MTRRLTLALTLIVAATAAAYAQPKEIVIGLIYPMSGPAAQAGTDDKPVFEIAADLANGAADLPFPFYQRLKGMPGLKGAKVRLIFADHQGKPEVGQAEAERLITQEKVAALVGCWHSNVTAVDSQVAERHGVPFLNAESSSPALTTRGFKWFFRTSPHDGHFTQVMFDFFREFQAKRGAKLKTLGLTYEDTTFGSDSGKVEKELAAKHGYEVVLDLQYRARATSLQSEVQRLKATNPDVWMPTSYQTDAILFVKTGKDLDYNPKMIMAQNAGHISSDFVKEAGREAEGTLTRAPFSTDLIGKRDVAKALNALYSKRAGKELYDFPARAFTGIMTLLDAINRAGSTDPEAVRKALVATNIAAGLSLIFGLMELVNFAHGEFLMVAMYVTFFAWSLAHLDPVVALPLAALALAGLGWAVYHGIIRWVLGGPMLAQVFATFGLAVLLRAGAQFVWGVDFRVVKDPWLAGRVSLGGVFVGLPQLAASALALAAFVALWWFLARTETGLALMATAQDRQAAALMGIDTQRMFALGWAIGSACVGVAGGLLAMFYYVFPEVGGVFALIAYVTVALGGFGNVPATLLAGVLVGLVEVFAGLLISPAMKYAVVFLLYLAVVLWRPLGLFGRF